MCNPNSSIASRRRTVALPSQLEAVSQSSNLLAKNYLGSMFRHRVHGGAVDANPSTQYTVAPKPTRQFPAPSNTAPTPGTAFDQTHFPHMRPFIPHPPDKQKTKPKRRRKPQKPGKTAKQNDRHFVIHDYHDHACDTDENDEHQEGQRRRGGVAVSFPLKLHTVLDQVEMDGLSHIVSWQSHGRCFVIHKPKEFVEHVMPNYFRQTKLTSFQRQLNLYGFARLTRGHDSGGYYHELFLRGKPFLCKRMVRTKVKGTKFKAASSPDQEPDFYSMPPVIVTPPTSDHSQVSEDDFNSAGEVASYTSRAIDVVSYQPSTPYSTNPAPLQPPPRTPTQTLSRYPTFNSAASPTATNAFATAAHFLPPRSADNVLDEAVDELFLEESTADNDSIIDFVNVWDPAAFGNDAALSSDEQLGNILDKLLED